MVHAWNYYTSVRRLLPPPTVQAVVSMSEGEIRVPGWDRLTGQSIIVGGTTCTARGESRASYGCYFLYLPYGKLSPLCGGGDPHRVQGT